MSRIDPLVRPLVSALTEAGLRPVASCQGHWWRLSGPYVLFEAPVALAARLARRLELAWRTGEPRLHACWSIAGLFTPEGDLRFRLHPPAADGAGWWQLRKAQRDFGALAQLVRDEFGHQAAEAPPAIQERSDEEESRETGPHRQASQEGPRVRPGDTAMRADPRSLADRCAAAFAGNQIHVPRAAVRTVRSNDARAVVGRQGRPTRGGGSMTADWHDWFIRLREQRGR
ncbi:MAG TPA: hypothetical protein ENJ83_02620 [Rhodospirillales bacterium]|nr:hypothetical protein [Rhodospirillales bacterium]